MRWRYTIQVQPLAGLLQFMRARFGPTDSWNFPPSHTIRWIRPTQLSAGERTALAAQPGVFSVDEEQVP